MNPFLKWVPHITLHSSYTCTCMCIYILYTHNISTKLPILIFSNSRQNFAQLMQWIQILRDNNVTTFINGVLTEKLAFIAHLVQPKKKHGQLERNKGEKNRRKKSVKVCAYHKWIREAHLVLRSNGAHKTIKKNLIHCFDSTLWSKN